MSGEPDAAAGGGPPFVEVAVPLPIDQTLVYSVAPAERPLARPGSRVRVAVGKRRVTGLVLAGHEDAPAGVKARPIDGVIDLEPLVPPELIELGRFTADYYLAPIGEVFRAMVPAGTEAWGRRRVWLTDAGALARPRDEGEARVVELLRQGGRLRLAELAAAVGAPAAERVVVQLERSGRVVVGAGSRRGARYAAAVDLAAGTLEELLQKSGRAPAGRQVVELLAALGRPATVEELTTTVGCGAGVVRRLAERGVLRRFSQIERLDLGQHLARGPRRPDFELRDDQERAVAALAAAVGKAGASGTPAAFLLTGVTGSGKTEVYLRGADRALADGGSAIVLVPEIALVPVLAGELSRRYGGLLAILHSGLSASERLQEWERIRRGQARLVLGPRSAVFAPARDLRLLVVDEEQDAAYKQDATPRYSARDLALTRAAREGAVALLASATPSLETRHNVERGKFARLELTRRVGQGSLPEGVLVDLRASARPGRAGEIHFTPQLLEAIERTLADGDQAILLRNRRGYAPILLCRACGEDQRCDDCGLPRTYHRRFDELLCHYCGSRRKPPAACPACGNEALDPVGAGTERVEERLAELFPGVPLDTLDRDTLRRRGSVAAVLERFARGDTRILVGTQMVSKGHHFPRVALTAMLAADTYLNFPDFRAVERTYNLLTQLAGRAGRGERAGKILIQSFHPEHYAIQAALEHDDERFAAEEMRFRRVFHYPPYTRMIQLLVRDRDRTRGADDAARLYRALRAHPLAEGVRIAGPAPAPFEKLRGKWRFQILVRAGGGGRLRRLVRQATAGAGARDLVVDVDPLELM